MRRLRPAALGIVAIACSSSYGAVDGTTDAGASDAAALPPDPCPQAILETK